MNLLKSEIKRFLSELTDLFVETRCLICNEKSGGLKVCSKCQSELSKIVLPPIPRKIGSLDVFYFGPHEDILRNMVLSFKFAYHDSLSKTLAELLKKVIDENKIDFEVITYVPATKSAKIKRGFDHMELVSKELSKLTGVKSIKLLEAVRETEQIRAKDRTLAVKDKYKVLLRNANNINKNLKILLLDDVVTTGRTLLECVKELDSYGFKNITCTVLCNAKD